jgi:hypothetical protein
MPFSKGNTPWNKGKPRPADTRKKIGEANKGKKRTIEARKKQSESHRGHEVSEETRRKISLANKGRRRTEAFRESQRGINHHSWKGGTANLNQKIRTCPNYVEWRREVYEKDSYQCQSCGDMSGGNLVAHHQIELALILLSHNIRTLEHAEACEDLWYVKNGVTLCEDCHKRCHKKVKVA